jgi:hypothetical protein
MLSAKTMQARFRRGNEPGLHFCKPTQYSGIRDSLKRESTMGTLTGREHRIIADVLVEVAQQPDVDVEFMQKVVRQTVAAAIAEDPLILHPAWFRDRIIRKLTELQTQPVPTPRPAGVSPHTRVVTLD